MTFNLCAEIETVDLSITGVRGHDEKGNHFSIHWYSKRTSICEYIKGVWELRTYDAWFVGTKPKSLENLILTHAELTDESGNKIVLPCRGSDIWIRCASIGPDLKVTYLDCRVDSEYLQDKWGKPVPEITKDNVRKIIDEALHDGLLDNVIDFESVWYFIYKLCLLVDNYRSDDYSPGCYCQSTNTLFIHDVYCEPEHARVTILHELLHVVCDNIGRLPDCSDDTVKNEGQKKAKLLSTLKATLSAAIPDFQHIQDIADIERWLYVYADDQFNAWVYRNCDFVDHDQLFWLLSLNIDCMVGWRVGTTMSYGMDRVVEKIVACKNQINAERREKS